jgi:hypothetical protein
MSVNDADPSTTTPGAALPSIEASLRLLQELLDLWQDNYPTTLPVFEERPIRGFSALSHVDHASKLTESVIALATSEMFVQLVPLVRMTLECAVTAAWFATASGSGDAALHEGTRLRRALVVDTSKYLGTNPAAALASLDAAKAELGDVDPTEAKYFERRCKSMEGGESLYISYRRLSEYSHAGSLLLDYYLQESEVSEANPLGFEYTPDNDPEVGRSAVALDGWLVHIALTAWNTIVPVAAVTEALERIATEQGFTSVVRRKTT